MQFSKQPSEETTRAVDFVNIAEIVNGETIATAVVTITDGGIAVPDMLVSSIVEGTKVMFRVKDGVDCQTYKITVLITTSVGHKREADIIMVVAEL